MSNASDIKNLFSRFGGNPQHYRELALENDAKDSAARWPLLANIANHKRLVPNAASVFQSESSIPAMDTLANSADALKGPVLRPALESVAQEPMPSPAMAPVPAPALGTSQGQSGPLLFSASPHPAVSDAARSLVSPLSRLQAQPAPVIEDKGSVQSVLRRLAHGGQNENHAPPAVSAADVFAPTTNPTKPTVSSVLSRLAKR